MTHDKSSPHNPRPRPILLQVFDNLEDPRKKSINFRHPLTTILFITVVCSLCGSNDWETIVIQANAMKGWLGRYVDLSNGVPCVRTFIRVFNVLKPELLNKVLLTVARSLGGKVNSEIISFDGKTLRGTASPEKGLQAVHMLNAWSHDRGICIGHMKVDDKSNEIPAVPQLMELLDLKGTIITSDALNTQKKTAAKAIELGADYILPVKENQPGLFEDVELLFKEAQDRNFKGIDADDFETAEKGHGRVEIRKYVSLDALDLPCTSEWAGLKSVGKITRERTLKGKTSIEIQYYISSCEIDAKLLERVTRGHWGIENSLHLVLDVTFREDHSRYRDRIGTQNLATIRKLAHTALSMESTLKCGKAGKRVAAATDPEYREKIMKLFF